MSPDLRTIITQDLQMKILASISRCAMAIFVVSAATAVFQGQTPASHVLQATTYESHFPPAAKGGEAWNGDVV
jgi:hypothetical protein